MLAWGISFYDVHQATARKTLHHVQYECYLSSKAKVTATSEFTSTKAILI